MTALEPGTSVSDARGEATAAEPAATPAPHGAATPEAMPGPTAPTDAATASNPSVPPGRSGEATAPAAPAPPAPIVQGWCPGARRPMMSGDGLVVRVRPTFSRLSAAQLAALADLADTHGSGLIEATARANLQLRGVTESAHGPLLQGLGGLGLLDRDAAAEARRNVVLTPFPGAAAAELDGIAAALARALSAEDGPRLPGKFGFVVDAAPGPRRLSAISGDIRIERSETGALLVRADGRETGVHAPDGAAAARLALILAHWFIASGGVGPDGRGRMARHLATGAEIPADLTGDLPPSAPAPSPAAGASPDGLLLSAPFGLFTAEALRAVAAAAGLAPVRVTPFRMLHLSRPDLPQALAAHPDLIADPADPLMRVDCCTGAPGCPQGQAETRPLARALAPLVPENARLHLSGCAKGCAHPGPAPIALTARLGRFDLVKTGRAWDEPHARGLAPETLPEALQAAFSALPKDPPA